MADELNVGVYMGTLVLYSVLLPFRFIHILSGFLYLINIKNKEKEKPSTFLANEYLVKLPITAKKTLNPRLYLPIDDLSSRSIDRHSSL